MEAKEKYSEQSGEIQTELSMLKEKLKRHNASLKRNQIIGVTLEALAMC